MKDKKVFVLVLITILALSIYVPISSIAQQGEQKNEQKVVVVEGDVPPGEVVTIKTFHVEFVPVDVVVVQKPMKKPDFNVTTPNGVQTHFYKDDYPKGTTFEHVTDQTGRQGIRIKGPGFEGIRWFPPGSMVQKDPAEPQERRVAAVNPVPLDPTEEAAILAALGLPDDPDLPEVVEAVDGKIALISEIGTDIVEVSLFTITPAVTYKGDFSIMIDPKHVNVKLGDSITYKFTISSIGEFDAPVELNLNIKAPLYDRTYSLPTQYPPYPKTYMYTVDIPKNVPPCTATGIITATGGGKTHTDVATIKIPGFEIVFAIVGLLAVAYILRKRR